jgi:predicted Zn-dependent peptidase
MMKKLTLLVAMVLIAASVTHAQQQYDEIEFPELNDFNKPDVETFTGDNGIKYYLLEDDELPLVDLSVRLRTGSVLVSDDKTGLASMTGQVMRSGGSEQYPADKLNKILENNAASMSMYVGFSQGGAGLNALKEDFEELLPVFVNVLTNPAFPEDKLELAKTQAKSGISRRNDNAGAIAGREFDKLIYGDDAKYARTTQYETINNISREDLVAFHQEHFNGQNMMVGVVGDFDADEMKNKLQNAFGDIPAGEKTDIEFPEVNYDFAGTVNLADKPDVNQSNVLLGHIGGMRDNPDYAKVQVMNNVLSGGFSGRLFQKVRTDLGLAYSVGGSYGMGNTFYPGTFTISVQTKTETTAEAIDAIMEEVEKLQSEAITEAELQDTKDQFLNSLVFRNTSYNQILNRQMSNEYRGLPEDSFEEFVKGVKNTTVKDVQNMAQKYLQPDNMEILVVGNKSEMGDQLQKYGDVNELDISIPQPGADQDEEMMQGDSEKGRMLLDQMAESIIEPGTEVNTLSVTGDVKLIAQNMTLGTTMTMEYPGNLVQDIETPQGTMTMTLKDGQATMAMAGQERQLPASSPQAQNLKSTINLSIITIAKKADELDPQFTGTETMEGTTYNQVNVNVNDKNISLFLSQDTNLPAMMQFQEFNAQQGSQVMVENRYSDWTSQGGVTYPYTQTSFSDGNKIAEAIYESHEVNGGN